MKLPMLQDQTGLMSKVASMPQTGVDSDGVAGIHATVGEDVAVGPDRMMVPLIMRQVLVAVEEEGHTTKTGATLDLHGEGAAVAGHST